MATDFNNPIKGHALDAALAFAWEQLSYVPFDGGAVKVEFEQCWDRVGTPLEHLAHRWRGTSSASTEEGYIGISVHVYCGDREGEPETTWNVEVSREARDCDGKYTSGRTVRFVTGEQPENVDEQPTRDHTAEAAGF